VNQFIVTHAATTLAQVFFERKPKRIHAYLFTLIAISKSTNSGHKSGL